MWAAFPSLCGWCVGVFAGEFLYWTVISFLVSRFLKVTARTLKIISKVAGAAVIIIGVFLIIKGLISISQ